MSDLVSAVVVKGKFHAKEEDGSRRMVTPSSENREVKVTRRQLLAFKGTLMPKAAADALAAADAEMAKAEAAMAEAEAKGVKKVSEADKSVEKDAEKEEKKKN